MKNLLPNAVIRPDVHEHYVELCRRAALRCRIIRNFEREAECLHLADLYEHCPTTYPALTITDGDLLPLRLERGADVVLSSPGQMCAEN